VKDAASNVHTAEDPKPHKRYSTQQNVPIGKKALKARAYAAQRLKRDILAVASPLKIIRDAACTADIQLSPDKASSFENGTNRHGKGQSRRRP
jgi:hypothetical protein